MILSDRLTRPILSENPITVQMLGICSALAVTTSMMTAATMCLALAFVICSSSALVSSIRRHIPGSIRLIVQITIIASLVIVADEFLKAFAYGVSERLSIFVSLIVTNCLVMGRAEAFAMHNGVRASVEDALGNAAGYSVILLTVAFIRELLGSGSLFGFPVMPLIASGGWFAPIDLMLKPPAAFFVLGGLVWLVHAFGVWRRSKVEQTTGVLGTGGRRWKS